MEYIGRGRTGIGETCWLYVGREDDGWHAYFRTMEHFRWRRPNTIRSDYIGGTAAVRATRDEAVALAVEWGCAPCRVVETPCGYVRL